MSDILKDIEDAATAADRARARLITWLCLAVILIVLALWGAHHFEQRGRQLERAGWLQKEVDARIAQEKKDAADVLRHQQIERETSERHQKELDKLRADAAADRAAFDRAGGLRISARACPAAGHAAATEAPGTSGRDEAGAGTIRLPLEVENDLWAIVNDADEVSAQLRACQGWIRANGFYGPKAADSDTLLDRMIAALNYPAEDNQ